MIDSGRGRLSFALDFGPDKRRFLDVEDPAIIDAFLSDVSSEDDEVGFSERKGMSVPFSRGFMGYVDDIPYSDAVSDIKMVEVVRGESSGAGCSSEDDYFIGVYTDGSMGGAGGRGGSRG